MIEQPSTIINSEKTACYEGTWYVIAREKFSHWIFRGKMSSEKRCFRYTQLAFIIAQRNDCVGYFLFLSHYSQGRRNGEARLSLWAYHSLTANWGYSQAFAFYIALKKEKEQWVCLEKIDSGVLDMTSRFSTLFIKMSLGGSLLKVTLVQLLSD